MSNKNRKRRTTEEFIEEVKKIHGNDYSYDDVVFVDTKTKVKVYCNIHKEYFEITPNKLLAGQGCPKCRYVKSSKNKTLTTEDFIKRAKEIWGNNYDYSKVEYKNSGEKVKIICPLHGEFLITPENHLHKTKPQGCPVCGRLKSEDKRRYTTDDFIKRAKEVWDNKFDYSKVEYVRSNQNVEIICPQHGSFIQLPANHLFGEGCPKCSSYHSKSENELYEFINSLYNDEIVRNERITLNGNEIDIFLKDKKIGIEYNGLRWHSELSKDNNYHLIKTEEALKQGVRLIHIFEDEWLFKKEIVKSRLKNILGLVENKVFARKCVIKTVSAKDASIFLDNNHIQGKCGSTIRYGLYYNDELVSLMTFGKTRHFIGNSKHQYELLRFCNKLNTNVVGGASRLLKHFIKINNPINIVSYADRRWSDGNLYYKLGFNLYNVSKPNYFYIIGNRRFNRFNFRKSVLVKQGYDKNKSEHQIMLDRKIYRIYDCGCLCFELNLK